MCVYRTHPKRYHNSMWMCTSCKLSTLSNFDPNQQPWSNLMQNISNRQYISHVHVPITHIVNTIFLLLRNILHIYFHPNGRSASCSTTTDLAQHYADPYHAIRSSLTRAHKHLWIRIMISLCDKNVLQNASVRLNQIYMKILMTSSMPYICVVQVSDETKKQKQQENRNDNKKLSNP